MGGTIHIDTLDGDLTTDKFIKMAAKGKTNHRW